MWNAVRIPSGIPALADYIHSLGLLFGVYSDACVHCVRMTLFMMNNLVFSGYYSCDFVGGTEHWLGSLGYEQSDANTFTEWGADYLKVCCVLRRHHSRDSQSHVYVVRQLLCGEQE